MTFYIFSGFRFFKQRKSSRHQFVFWLGLWRQSRPAVFNREELFIQGRKFILQRNWRGKIVKNFAAQFAYVPATTASTSKRLLSIKLGMMTFLFLKITCREIWNKAAVTSIRCDNFFLRSHFLTSSNKIRFHLINLRSVGKELGKNVEKYWSRRFFPQCRHYKTRRDNLIIYKQKKLS